MFSEDIKCINRLFKYYKTQLKENVHVFIPTKNEEHTFIKSLIDVKKKLSCQDSDYITMMCKSKFKLPNDVDLHKINAKFANNVILKDEPTKSQYKLVFLTILFILVECTASETNQKESCWNALNALRVIEKRPLGRVLRIEEKMSICEKEIRRQFEYKNKDNLVFIFLSVVRSGRGKYGAFWRNRSIEDSVSFAIDDKTLNLDYVYSLMKENEYQKTLGTPSQSSTIEKDVDRLYNTIVNLKKSSIVPVHFSMKNSSLSNNREIDISYLNTNILKNVKLSNAVTMAMTSFKTRFKDKFEVCLRDITLFEELVMFYYNTKSPKNEYKIKKTVKHFLENLKKNPKITKTSEIGAIEGPKNINASLKGISKSKKLTKKKQKKNKDFTRFRAHVLKLHGKPYNSLLRETALLLIKHSQ